MRHSFEFPFIPSLLHSVRRPVSKFRVSHWLCPFLLGGLSSAGQYYRMLAFTDALEILCEACTCRELHHKRYWSGTKQDHDLGLTGCMHTRREIICMESLLLHCRSEHYLARCLAGSQNARLWRYNCDVFCSLPVCLRISP